MSGLPTGSETQTLTEALRERTAALHTMAERSGVIADILHRKADKRAYALLLRNLLPAYQEMEQALECHAAKPVFAVFATPALYRADAIAADLATLSEAEDYRDLPLLPAAQRYAACVAQAGEGDGTRLIAHAYVRYLGDLSGGQILKKLLAKSLDLQPHSLSFYDFPQIADANAFKAVMRETIDRESRTINDREAVLREGMLAFEHNIAVSKSVQDFLVAA